MKKINIIKKNEDFTRIIKKRKGLVGKYFIINIENNNINKTQFGITFVKNIGNAVTRNKLKRQTKDIIDKNNLLYENKKNYIIIIRKTAITATYQELSADLCNISKNKGAIYEK